MYGHVVQLNLYDPEHLRTSPKVQCQIKRSACQSRFKQGSGHQTPAMMVDRRCSRTHFRVAHDLRIHLQRLRPHLGSGAIDQGRRTPELPGMRSGDRKAPGFRRRGLHPQGRWLVRRRLHQCSRKETGRWRFVQFRLVQFRLVQARRRYNGR